jgi:hypothetical protein
MKTAIALYRVMLRPEAQPKEGKDNDQEDEILFNPSVGETGHSKDAVCSAEDIQCLNDS